MIISDNGLNLIKKFEGFRTAKYQDQGGNWTIGYGHEIESDENYDDGITQESATELLRQDVARVENAINDLVAVALTQGQFDALVSLVYNWGIGNFKRSHGLELLNEGLYDRALAEFESVDRINGVVTQGLRNRRLSEADLWNGATVA